MQLTAAKLLSADVLMLAGPSGHSDMDDMSGVRTCWRTSLLASSVPHTSTPFLEQDVHAQRRLPEPQTGNLQGHEERQPFRVCLEVQFGRTFTDLLNATTRRDGKRYVAGVVRYWSRHHRLSQVMATSKRVADDLTCLIDPANAPIFGIDILGKDD